ncbi:O-antigen ligase domain-containing protein [Carnobacterium sp. PL24RED07]|uniref:O-antigen ligase family protein n=1 Tax=Carnobacterium sp. PL24RED07 TaxID=2592354 RepID=UPI0011EE1F03|nr:O-antigen ligase family protein [Carnobacterium sp. PL24RED07]KAF3300264.1 O-antigen ligase domain-containing protein [Carnobacterium sp. PL26RED25]KAF3304914.1 O-antigen ligase domain-containing protein [Carnobacterium sp. PL24RED07]
MLAYLIFLVSSVFLGSNLIAVTLPVGQISIYRIFSLLVIPMVIFFLIKDRKAFKIRRNSYATGMVTVYLFWWVWALCSVLWAMSIGAWLQAMVLLTLGISSILGIFLWTRDYLQWRTLIKAVWVMMTFLSIWGLFEITTNIYLLADLGKLDKYSTFLTQPWTRIPITYLANQNDYATILLASLPINLILMNTTKNSLKKLLTLVCMLLSTFLIFQSGSRMSLLMALAFYGIYVLLGVRWDFTRKQVLTTGSIILTLATLAFAFVPPIRGMVTDLIYILPRPVISGDVGRMNMWRNGLMYLGKTFGLGVGAGNIEVWMEIFGPLPTNNIFNIHNWWLEILVGYGVFIFIAYVLGYALMIYRLFNLKKFVNRMHQKIMNAFISFLLVFIGASITSANNMLIEWHWVFFGLIIAYIGIMEAQVFGKKKRVA